MKTPKVLIIPDVHGRTFWKDALKKFPQEQFQDLQIVFLGDYLDPYTGYENISKEDAFINFEDILYCAKQDSRITLLIGNHDWHYFVNLDTCRIDHARERDIEHMFIENMSMFRLTKTIELNGCKYLFSHAGITQKWLDDVSEMAAQEYNKWNTRDSKVDEDYKWIKAISEIKDTHNFELFEKCLKNYDNSFYTAPMSMISRDRGGWFPHGSLIWADVHEHIYVDDLKKYYQIFGHTMSYPQGDPKRYVISPEGRLWAMLDASQSFILDSTGNITPIEELNY